MARQVPPSPTATARRVLSSTESGAPEPQRVTAWIDEVMRDTDAFFDAGRCDDYQISGDTLQYPSAPHAPSRQQSGPRQVVSVRGGPGGAGGGRPPAVELGRGWACRAGATARPVRHLGAPAQPAV